jgi:aminopeptidase N
MRSILAILLFPIFALAQQPNVDFKTCQASISIDATSKSVSGDITYEFDLLSKTDTVTIDAVDMTFANVRLNKKNIAIVSTPKALKLFGKLKKGKNSVTFSYSATPRQTLYFTGQGDDMQIWTQGQGKYTSHWLPSFDDVNEKVVFNLSISYAPAFTVLSNGTLQSKKPDAALMRWQYQMQQPMSSYLVMLAIGKFVSQTEKSASGIPLEMYVAQGDADKIEPTYRYGKRLFDFLEREIGVGYPWQVYRQVPVRDFLYAGMENTSATVFAQDFVVDGIGFNDQNYINVNAHELAHQWFGDLVTAKTGAHHWLQEGFATYYALLAEREIFGEDHFQYELYRMAGELQAAAAKDTVPVMNPKASSLTFYKKGAWALHVLREGVGAENFGKAVRNYLKKYAFKNVDTDDFLAEIKAFSNFDTEGFKKRWLENGGFEVDQAISMLQKNAFMKRYFELMALQPKPYAEKHEKLLEIVRSDAFYPLRVEAIVQTDAVPYEEKKDLLDAALGSGDINVRQAVAATVGKIPARAFADFEALLDDASYTTRGLVLNLLWQQFPEKQVALLEKTKGNIGFNDKNLRIQWLTLALGTRSYEKDKKIEFYDELLRYTSPEYESSIRQNALENLLFFNPNDMNVLKALVSPLVHHKWQFVQFAREVIRTKIKRDNYREFYERLLPSLPEPERAALQKILSEKR